MVEHSTLTVEFSTVLFVDVVKNSEEKDISRQMLSPVCEGQLC